MKKTKKIAAVITDVLGDRVVIVTEALEHVIDRHFPRSDREACQGWEFLCNDGLSNWDDVSSKA